MRILNILKRIILCSILFCYLIPVSTALAESVLDRIARQKAMPIESNQWPDWPLGPVVSAESAILMDANTGAILYEKNIHQKQYPASTTKILTTLIISEMCDMDERVTFSREAVFDTPRDSNHIAMDVGQELSIEDCLNAILIRSANEVCFACAEHITGTGWQDFAEIMNKRAEELGCLNSHFVNPNGLPDPEHYTTAYDLATIGRAFFANENLCEISVSPRLHILPSENQPNEKIENSKNELLPGKKYAYEYLIGAKTGYTDTARSALVTCAEKDGMKLICVVLHDEAPYQYEDTIALFNYGFGNFSKINISETEQKYNVDDTNLFYNGYDIFGNSTHLLSINKEASIIIPKTLPFEAIESSISYENVSPGQAALLTYSYHGQVLGTASIDIASMQEGYDFATPITQIEKTEPMQNKKALTVIPFPVLLIMLMILAGMLILLSLFMNKKKTSYNKFGSNPFSSTRKEWKRQQRKERWRK